MTLVLSDLRRDRVGDRLETSVALRLGDDRHRLSIFHGGDFGPLAEIAPSFDPFLLFLLIPAMARNLPVVVEGSIDAQRLDGLRRGVQVLLSQASEAWHIVPIEAEARSESPPPDLSKGAALGMSCGIDSLYTFEDLRRPDVPAHQRIKLLTHNHIGAHPDLATFERHFSHVRRFADAVGLPLVSVTADLARYYGRRFIHSHSMRNLGAAISLEPLFHTFFYAKGDYGLEQARLGRAAGIGPMDPAMLPLLNTSAHSFYSHGMHAERLAKSDLVMRGDLAPRFLTVCTHGLGNGRAKINCGRCYKCARALFFAETIGRLDDFAETFDLAAFRAGKGHALRRMLRLAALDRKTRDDQEMLAYLFEQGYPLPPWFWLFRRAVGTSSLTESRRLRAGAKPC